MIGDFLCEQIRQFVAIVFSKDGCLDGHLSQNTDRTFERRFKGVVLGLARP